MCCVDRLKPQLKAGVRKICETRLCAVMHDEAIGAPCGAYVVFSAVRFVARWLLIHAQVGNMQLIGLQGRLL